MDTKIKVVSSEYKYSPDLSICINIETDIEDVDLSELKSDITSFKEYLLERYYKKDEKKAWYKFWKK